MTSLRAFTAQTAAIHGLEAGPAKVLGLVVGRDHPDFAPQSKGGRNASPTLTPAMAALFIIGRLAGGFQKDARERADALWQAPAGGISQEARIVADDHDAQAEYDALPRCTITRCWNFGAAVLTILSSPALAREVDRVEIRHGLDDAVVIALDGRMTRFASRETLVAVAASEAVQTLSYLTGAGLVRIADMISAP